MTQDDVTSAAWLALYERITDAIPDHAERKAILQKLTDLRTSERLEWSGKVEELRRSQKERDILEHAVGFRSKTPFYRNHYAATPECDTWPTLLELCRRGLMIDTSSPSEVNRMHYFQVTEAGKAILG